MSRAAHADEYRALYYEWEGARWAVAQIDFERDAADLDSLPWADALVAQVAAMKSIVHVLPEAVVALADAAPQEDQQVFFTTHMADAAREIVLFDRFLTDVASGRDKTVADALEQLSEEISRRSREVKPGDVEAIARATVGVSDVEAHVLSPWQGMLRDALDDIGALPGLREGLRRVRADHDRHERFAVQFVDDLSGDSNVRADENVGARVVGMIASTDALFDGAPFTGTDLLNKVGERGSLGANS